jgi:N-acyl-D-aspartate/D-glutamate deacylase
MGFSTTISPSHSDADGHPVPSRQSSRTELIELAGVLRAHPGTSLEMTPTVGAFEAEHKQLMAEMSVAAQRPLNWNLLAPAIDDSDEFVEGQLNATDLARSLGGEVICLTAGQPILLRVNLHSGFIFDIFEGWGEAFQLPIDERIAFFADPTRRGYLDRAAKNATAKSLMQLAQWENLVVESVVNKALEPNVGLSIGEIAERDGKRPIDAMLDLAVADGLKTVFLAPSVGGNDRESRLRRGRIWSDDRTIIGASDAGAHLDMIDSFALYTHVLGSGVREHGLLPLELAIRQLTQVPAQLYGLHDRGELKPGYRADIVLFDPDTIACGPVYVRHDLPGNEMRLFADAIGIRHVLVNGVETIRDGVHSGALPGSVLRSGRDTHTARMPVAAGVFPQAA